MGFGYVVKELLRDRKKTIKQLAHDAEIPVNTLYSITKRDSKRVDPVIAGRIFDALQVSVGELLTLKPSIDTPENRKSIEDGLSAFLQASDDYSREIRKRLEVARSEDFKKLDNNVEVLLYELEATKDGPKDTDLLAAYRKLNKDGQRIAIERVEELTQIAKYQLTGKTEAPELPPEPLEDAGQGETSTQQEKPSEGQ